MELGSTRETRRNERLAKTTVKKADTASAKARPQPASQQKQDKCTLSRQALAYLEQQNELQQKLDEQRARQQNRLAESQDKSSELELLEKGLDVLDKCMKIAASIMKGNRVPMKDLKYLMENDPAGYKLAMAMRRKNPDPEDEKSVLDDEDQDGAVEESGGGESPSAASAGSSEGGGEASAATA